MADHAALFGYVPSMATALGPNSLGLNPNSANFLVPPPATGQNRASASDDTLVGTPKNDGIMGLASHDKLFGWAGDDRLDGNDGADTLKWGKWQ
jgi:RTX calcium-binding nonapeptide repeat (4 copies)